ncbi:MAG: FecR domain-containing protein [Treponema sp.]|nr:FecR domain-containing protein [Candidatus Treponema equifaecale]
MKKRIFTRHPFFNFFLNILLFLGIAASAYEIYKNLQQPFSEFEEKPVAYINRTRGLVQKQSEQRDFFSLIVEESKIYSSDTVTTDSDSFAEILFLDGNHLYLNENSTIKFEGNGKQIFLSYVHGEIMLTSSENSNPVFLISGTDKIHLRPESELEIYTEQDFSTKHILAIKKGCAEISEYNPRNPFAQPVFLLPPKLMKAGESIVINKSISKN